MKKMMICSLALAWCCAPALADEPESQEPLAKIGEAAPVFTAEAYTGETVNLEDYKGKNIVVLEWFNYGCPVCRGHVNEKTIINMVEEYSDVKFFGIDSTHFNKGKEQEVMSFLKENGINYPIVKDPEGKIGHLYGAKTTPHMFVIDKEGILRYDGAIDNKRGGDGELNYVVAALDQIQAGETVEVTKTKSYGCSVKYKGAKGWGGKRGRGGPREGRGR